MIAAMRRLLLFAVLLAALAAPAPASAIINGTADGQRHPSVGGLVSPTAHSGGTYIYCSGTLISPTVFLTAAHCAEEGERVGVTFDSAYEPGDTVSYGTFHADPLYNQRQSDTHDIAVVVLDQAVRGSRRPGCRRPIRCRACRSRSRSPRSATAPTRSRTARAGTGTSTTTSAW
jgi:secreted trypsin-like serine protease